MTLVEFLLARIAEDEAEVVAWPTGGNWGQFSDKQMWVDPNGHPIYAPRERVLAECAAKRRLINLHVKVPAPTILCRKCDGELSPGDRAYMCINCGSDCVFDDLEGPVLAAVYADHSDYREEWKP